MLNFTEKRKQKRYLSIAKVRLPETFAGQPAMPKERGESSSAKSSCGEALLKDISVTGCRIECTMHVDIEENSEHTITVCPEDNAGIGRFDLLVMCKWINSGSYTCNIGFSIKKSPGKKDFERYVDYLSWRQNT